MDPLSQKYIKKLARILGYFPISKNQNHFKKFVTILLGSQFHLPSRNIILVCYLRLVAVLRFIWRSRNNYLLQFVLSRSDMLSHFDRQNTFKGGGVTLKFIRHPRDIPWMSMQYPNRYGRLGDIYRTTHGHLCCMMKHTLYPNIQFQSQPPHKTFLEKQQEIKTIIPAQYRFLCELPYAVWMSMGCHLDIQGRFLYFEGMIEISQRVHTSSTR